MRSREVGERERRKVLGFVPGARPKKVLGRLYTHLAGGPENRRRCCRELGACKELSLASTLRGQRTDDASPGGVPSGSEKNAWIPTAPIENRARPIRGPRPPPNVGRPGETDLRTLVRCRITAVKFQRTLVAE